MEHAEGQGEDIGSVDVDVLGLDSGVAEELEHLGGVVVAGGKVGGRDGGDGRVGDFEGTVGGDEDVEKGDAAMADVRSLKGG